MNTPTTTPAILFHAPPSLSAGETPAPNSILSQALLQNGAVKVVRFVFAAGQELSEHTAAVCALIQQSSGNATWKLGETVTEAAPGDWAFLPAHLPHSIRATEDSVVLLLLLKGAGGERA
jgi:quercetin dioxygenase-like cupin family protein